MQLPAHIGSSLELSPVIVGESIAHETFDASLEAIHAEVGSSVSELLKKSGIVFASTSVQKPITLSTEGKNPEWMVH